MAFISVRIALLICFAIITCCLNVIFLELIIKDYSSSHNLITLSQFLFITLCTFSPSRLNSKVPISQYTNLVVLYFLVTLSGNYALGFNISMPLHMIFKSGSLIANLILSVIAFKRRYKLSKYLAVLIITIGIILCTLASSKNFKPQGNDAQENITEYYTWLFGILLLVFSLFGSAQTGIYQEKLIMKYGKNTDESLFFCHALLLPGFTIFWKNILNAIIHFNNSDPLFEIGPLALLPKLWIYLLANVITQYCCSKSIFILSAYCPSLTITLVITLRKFCSLILSIYIFDNTFTLQHWFGTALVFLGTILFTELHLFFFKNKKVE